MNLLPYPAYQDSGIPWLSCVPAGWRVVRLRDLCTGISTGPFGTSLGSDDYVSEGIPVINPSHIVGGRCVPDSETTISEETANRLAAWRMVAGDIVIARRGELGRSAIVLPSQSGWVCGTGSLRVTPNPTEAYSPYLQAVMQSTYTREWLSLASVGSTMQNISEAIVGALPIWKDRKMAR